jgi:hypothetical protein
MKIELDTDLVNQILGYLGTRPYQEVYQLIQTTQEAARASLAQQQPKVDDGNSGD